MGERRGPVVIARSREAGPRTSPSSDPLDKQGARDLDRALVVAAHELRDPLLGARAAVEHVLTDAPLSTDDAALLRRTEQELTQLAGTVEALLRLGVGTARPRRRRVDLVGLTRQAISSCSLRPGPERVRFRAPERLHVAGDPVHLRTAVENVVRNALAYSPRGSVVNVDVTAAGDRAEVSVRDRGAGLAQIARLPDPTADPTVERAPAVDGGHGLGLFIAQRIMDAHGGDISCHASPDGPGTVFLLRLPTHRAASPTPFPGGGRMV